MVDSFSPVRDTGNAQSLELERNAFAYVMDKDSTSQTRPGVEMTESEDVTGYAPELASSIALDSKEHNIVYSPDGDVEKSNDAITNIINVDPEDCDPPQEYLTSWRLFIIITCLYFGTFLVAIDTSMLTVAVPIISSDLHFLSSVAWISSAYTLTMTAFQPLFGSLYRLFKVEVVYQVCIIVFEVGSIVCATAQTGPAFIIGRAIAGLGAAGLVQGALCIISHTVKFEQRSFYNGIVTSVFGVAICFGPILGGVLTTKATWPWCFWLNLPVGAVTIVALLLFLKVRVPKKGLRALSFKDKLLKIDLLGTLVFVGAICCILLALQYGGQEHPWNSALIIGLLVGGFGLLLFFGLAQWKRGDDGLLPLSVLGQRSILSGFGTLVLIGAANVVICFYIPFYFQAVQGVDAITSGVRFIAYFLPLMVAVAIAGAVVSKWGHYVPLMILGELIFVAGTACLIRLKVDTPTVQWAAFLVVAGIGIGIAQQLPYTAVHVVLKEDDVPIGNAIMVFAWLIGGAISVAIGQNICLDTIRTELPLLTSEISPEAAIHAGGYGLDSLAASPAALTALHQVWNIAVSRALIFSLAAACAVVPVSAAMEWKNSRREGERRAAVLREGAGDGDGKT